MTPELEKNAVGQLVCGEPADCAVGPTRLFRPKRQEGQKMLFLIRHGESEFNKACKDPSNHVDEPLIWDPDLTDRGRDQVTRGHVAMEDLGRSRTKRSNSALATGRPSLGSSRHACVAHVPLRA